MWTWYSILLPPLLAVGVHALLHRPQYRWWQWALFYLFYALAANAVLSLGIYTRDGSVYALIMRNPGLSFKYMAVCTAFSAVLPLPLLFVFRRVHVAKPLLQPAPTRHEGRWPLARYIVGGLLLLVALLLFLGTNWTFATFGALTPDKFLFQIQQPLVGTGGGMIGSFIVKVALPALVFAAALTLAMVWPRRKQLVLDLKLRKKTHAWRPARTLRHHFAGFMLVVLLLSFWANVSRLKLPAYFKDLGTDNLFIEENYVDPATVQLRFPEQKRNLIYIYLESMENTFADISVGGAQQQNWIPELTNIVAENTSFSSTDQMGGALQITATGWTSAAMVAQTCGIPLNTQGISNADAPYLQGAFSLGQVLEREGYNQTLMIGSDSRFGERLQLFRQHGDYEIFDYYTAIERGLIPKDYYVWWGFEDEKLFSFAQAEITRLASLGAPFNFTMLTVDTHTVDGYVCPLCRDDFPDQYANVMACSSRQVAAFVSWIQAQPFYENTTIVLVGDHVSMNTVYFDGYEPPAGYERTTLNAFINPVATPNQTHHRLFTSMDMYPTTLAALGVQIEGERMALGVNLFSDTPTLVEAYGFDVVDEALRQRSSFYNMQIV